MDQKRQKAGYLAKNRNLNYIIAIVGAVWAALEWVSGSMVWFAAAVLMIVLSIVNLLSPIGKEAHPPKE